MRACLVLVALVAVVGVQARRSASQTRFEHGLEIIINKLKQGNTNLPIKLPSLRPLKIRPLQLKYLDYTMDISEATVEGLEKLKVEKVRASEPDLRVYLAFSVPGTIVADADEYHLVATPLDLVGIDDKGRFRAKVNNLRAAANVTFSSDGSNTRVANLELDFSANAQVYLSGSNELVTELINSLINELMADRDSVIFERAKEIVIELLDEHLRGHTPAELIKLIENEA